VFIQYVYFVNALLSSKNSVFAAAADRPWRVFGNEQLTSPSPTCRRSHIKLNPAWVSKTTNQLHHSSRPRTSLVPLPYTRFSHVFSPLLSRLICIHTRVYFANLWERFGLH